MTEAPKGEEARLLLKIDEGKAEAATLRERKEPHFSNAASILQSLQCS